MLLQQMLDKPLNLNGLIVAAGVVFAIGLVYSILSKRDSLNEPKKIPYLLPFVGHALSFAKDKRAFFLRAHALNNEQPFTAHIGGRNHYIFSDPADVTAVHKNAKSLNIRGFVRFIYISIWGFKPSDADKLWEIKPEWHRIDMDWLLGIEKNEIITVKYLTKLEEQLQVLDAQVELSPGNTLSLDCLKTIISLQGKATVQTLYGETTLERHPGLLDDLSCMVGEGFWPLMFRLPRFTAREPYKARDRLIAAYKELYEQYKERDDLSSYFVERFDYLKANNMSGESMGSDCLRTMFASLLNSMPTGYLALLHILIEPGLLAAVREELTDAGYSNLAPTDLISILPSKTPLLRSIWFETLRMHNNSLTVREVIAPTKLVGTQTWDLKKGGVVSIPCGLMHFNESLHPQPYEFHADRFLEKSRGGAGESAAKTTKPFGGGSTHCPGRMFAEKQMIGLVAGFVMRYDVVLTNGDKFVIPPVSEFDDIWNRPRAHITITKRVVPTV